MKNLFTFLFSCFVWCCYAQSQTNIEPVDLGLPSGTKWANMNLEATEPSEAGGYFAWGETKSKMSFNENNYKFYKSITTKEKDKDGFETSKTMTGYTKYVYDSQYAFDGVVDNKTSLEDVDDAAFQILGKEWHIPTVEQWKELITKCEWIEGKLNNISGYKVTGPNGNWIFFPCAGYAEGDSLFTIFYSPEGEKYEFVLNIRNRELRYCCKDLYVYEKYESDEQMLEVVPTYYTMYHGIAWNGNKWYHTTYSYWPAGIKGAAPYGLFGYNFLSVCDRYQGLPIRAVTNQNVSGIENVSENTKSTKTVRKYIINGKSVIDSGEKRYNINGTRIY